MEFDDLRSLALNAAGELGEIADRFPLGEPARVILQNAARLLKIHYAYTASQKKKVILKVIFRGNERIADIVSELGLRRPEIETLLEELSDSGYVDEREQKPSGGLGGRPFRAFELTEKGCLWIKAEGYE